MISRLYLIIVFFLFASLASAQNAILKGRITDGTSNEPLPGAYIHFDNLNKGAVTDAFGNFEFDKLSPGEYKIKVKYIGFEEFEKEINIAAGQVIILNIPLAEHKKDLNTVNVYGKLNESNESSSRQSEKNANNITNVLSARAMERSPDLNAATAITRVSAVTLQRNSGSDEAYAIIRGLEPRYNNSLINGVKVTSPDPVSRFVSLTIVPSDLLDRIEVSKTLTPEMEGDAIGGTVNLVFKDAPDHEYFKADVSLGYSAIFFNRKYDSFDEGAVQRKSPIDRFGSGYLAPPGYFSRPNLDFTKTTAPPTSLASFTYGRRFFNNKLGFIVSDSYQNQYYGTNSEFNIAILDPQNNNRPIISDVANRTYSTQQLNNGLSGHLDYKFDDKNKISLDNVFLYTYIAQARLSIDTSIIGGNGGRVGPGTGTVYNDNRSYIQNQYVENLKLSGKHIIAKHFQFDWAGIYSNATANSPDRADLTLNHLINPDFTSTPNYFDAISRIWSKNGNKDLSATGSLSYTTDLGGNNNSLQLKAGGLYRHSTRFNKQNQYELKPAPEANGVKSPFTDIYSANWIVYNVTGSLQSDVSNYTAFEDITAGYGQFKLTLNKLDVIGGVRVEGTKQGYDTNPVVLTVLSSERKTYTDLLPSLQLKYKLNDLSNFRASYFKSISRPALFELVPTATFGEATDINGNPFIKHSEADNYDLRYELFPKNEEQFFLGAFYKNIKNPIEFALQGLDQGGQASTQPQNFGTAKVAGAEVVYSRYFGNLGISGNYTYTYSNIKSPKVYNTKTAQGKDTSILKPQDRPLQGQTGNVINLSLLYKNDKHKEFIQLAYTYTSKTIPFIYNGYGYDYYTQPQSFLALSGEKQVSRHFTLTAKVNNILNTPTTVKIDNLIQSKDLYNVSFNLGLRYSL
ncbi:TonB-dependent receptor domain-containing protein [Mucilaginibacter sp. McL0603]|uniref:TonB-dependent receptor n=1 Tax=Mucilaginibacter sp. McL0603 TaxID=3415670 RepID=UPI003CEA4EB0